MELTIDNLKIGDWVKVKEGVKSPDDDTILMDNWQGKVVGIDKGSELIEIEWDDETLHTTPISYLKMLLDDGYDVYIMTLALSELTSAEKRITSKQTSQEVEAKLYWLNMYEEEAKCMKYLELFKGIKREMLAKWEDYLSENLSFPFEVEVVEYTRGPIRQGELIKILGIADYEDSFGVLGMGKHDKQSISYPMCDVEATDKKSANYEILRDYVIYFANR